MTKNTYSPFFVADVRRAETQAFFTFGSAFSGAGGADLGYSLAGGRPAFAIERDPEAVRTFRRNFPDVHVEQRDFREVAANAEVIDKILHRNALGRGDLDLFHASPPCNEISHLGSGPQDGGSAELIFDVVGMTKVARPRVLVVENVPNLARRHRYLLDAALELLRSDAIGRRIYYANWRILRADDYGVPQERHRLFLLAVRADVCNVTGITSDQDMLRLFPSATHAPISVEAALAGLRQRETALHPFRRVTMTSNLGHLARRLPVDPQRWTRARDVGLGGYRFTTMRMARNRPSPTLTACGQQPDGRSGIIHHAEPRKLSVPEMMRLSSWPDDFVFTGTVAQAAIRLGMSVPPLMAKAIGESVYERVLRPYHEATTKT